MKGFTLFLVTILLIWSSYSYVGFGIVGPFTLSAFTCLQSNVPNSNKYAVIRAYQNSHSPAGIDPNALQSLTNAYTAGFSADLYVEICRGINATSQINLVHKNVLTPLINKKKERFNGFFAIKVVLSSNPDCSWAGYSHSDNCNFLKEAVKAAGSLGSWFPTVFSTARIWAQFFGSSCDTFASDTGSYLQYANYDVKGHLNSIQSFADYVPFGGWTSDSIVGKQIGGYMSLPLLCGSRAWDQYYFP